MIEASREMAVYAGAGLSTSAGISDYATKAEDSAARPAAGAPSVTCAAGMATLRRLRPTYAHRVLATLGRQGKLKHFVNQNHDGLAFKAGTPPHIVNEIHGGWFDRRNIVVKMSGTLRGDLFDRMERTAATADLTLAVGTSLSGLCADQVADEPARRAAAGRPGAL